MLENWEEKIQPGLVSKPELLHTSSEYLGHPSLIQLRNGKTHFWFKDKVALSVVLFSDFKDKESLWGTRGLLPGPYPVARAPLAGLLAPVLRHGSVSLPPLDTLPGPPRLLGDLPTQRGVCRILPCDLRASLVFQ